MTPPLRRPQTEPPLGTGYSAIHITLIGILLAAILASRHPAMILHPELWGEDGWNWYPEAYYHGWQTLFWPHTGYLQFLPRLAGLAAQAMPLQSVPHFFMLIGMACQITPALFLISSRMSAAWPSLPGRTAFAMLHVTLPHSFEVMANLTNAQWHMAILSFYILLARAPQNRLEQGFDTTALLLSGLTGPFCLLLLPIAAWQARAAGWRSMKMRLLLLGTAAALQILFLMVTIHVRSGAPLGASPARFVRIVSTNIILTMEFGLYQAQRLTLHPIWINGWFAPLAVFCAATAAIITALRIGPPMLRKAWLAASLTFAAALIHPEVSDEMQQWQMMTYLGWGDRYYIFPMLAWAGTIFTLAAAHNRIARSTGIALLALLLIAIVNDWHYPPMAITDFQEKAKAFATAPPGTTMRFGEHPDGATMLLIRK